MNSSNGRKKEMVKRPKSKVIWKKGVLRKQKKCYKKKNEKKDEQIMLHFDVNEECKNVRVEHKGWVAIIEFSAKNPLVQTHTQILSLVLSLLLSRTFTLRIDLCLF